MDIIKNNTKNMLTNLKPKEIKSLITDIMPFIVDINDIDEIKKLLYADINIDSNKINDFVKVCKYLYNKSIIDTNMEMDEIEAISKFIYHLYGIESTNEIPNILKQIIIFDKNTNWKVYNLLYNDINQLCFENNTPYSIGEFIDVIEELGYVNSTKNQAINSIENILGLNFVDDIKNTIQNLYEEYEYEDEEYYDEE